MLTIRASRYRGDIPIHVTEVESEMGEVEVHVRDPCLRAQTRVEIQDQCMMALFDEIPPT